ncbi:dihydrolipoyl dehydrogenase family protein [Caenispirillum bisanense]|uniref:dihydrolipoyl dehydrogenase family protein n=1 Tax=Caenispirillum bisanense TaxID=414052 RepID=UPI0031CF84CB
MTADSPLTPDLCPDLCVIGAGSGGLSVAAGAVQMGASVVLVERGEMGGDCLNAGCVPSKALLAAAGAARAARQAGGFGLRTSVAVDFPAVMAHVQAVIAAIAPHDSQARFESLGCTVLRAPARFLDARRLQVGETVVRPRRTVLATGSRPTLPDLPGLAAVPVLTNESLFTLREAPERLVILGGGPIGVEMASAFLGLGVPVSLATGGAILPKDDPDLRAVVRAALVADGLDLHEHARAVAVEPGPVLVLEDGRRLAGSHLLVAAGRSPTVAGLGLDAAGIDHDPRRGIATDARLRTSNRRVYAVGDCAGPPYFTHRAGHDAGIVLRNALFRLPARARHDRMPWVTYGDPELAQVGLTEAAARDRHGDRIRVLVEPFAGNDRARAERRTEGLLKLVTDRRGRVLGCGIVGPQAGELLAPWVLALAQGLRVTAVADLVLPYPTLAETGKRAAGAFLAPALFGPATRRLVRLLARLG